MNKTDSISFWIPIVPDASASIDAKEWFRGQADQLISWGRAYYHLEPNDMLVLEQGPELTWQDIALKIALWATVVLPIIAAVIKVSALNFYSQLPANQLPLTFVS